MSGVVSIVVTGASGFIGYHTVLKFVESGFFVYAFVRKSIREELWTLERCGKIGIVAVDLGQLVALREVLADIPAPYNFVHCAGRASDVGWEREFRMANYDTVRNLTEIVREDLGSKLVFVSTTDVYGLKDFSGENEGELPYDKKSGNFYPKYKIKAEESIMGNLPAHQYCIIRPAAVWGWDDPTITARIRDFLAFSPFIVHFGRWRGKNRWPLVHVDSVALANYIASVDSRALGMAVNVIDPERVTVDEFYRMVASMCFPGRKYRTVNLPFWVGYVFGFFVALISNAFNMGRPFVDPSLYALYSVSSNLDLDSSFFERLRDGY